jgi:hypothetical protein
VARVVAHLPDLLFGSKVQGMLAAAGHDVVVAGTVTDAVARLDGADLLVADLCEDAPARIAAATGRLGDVRSLAFYLHTDVQTRTNALAAGFDLVVPRSRMAREGAALVDGLLGQERVRG